MFFCGCSFETSESYYINLDAAKKDIEKGWIPDILPESAHDIYKLHNLDSNDMCMKYRFDKDIENLIQEGKEVKPEEIAKIDFLDLGVNWWPQWINKEYFKKQNSDIKLYISDDKQEYQMRDFFVIDTGSNIAYYWVSRYPRD